MKLVGETVCKRTVLFEGHVALIFGTADLRFADRGKPDRVSSLHDTLTYVKRQGRWRMRAAQMQPRAHEIR
jgi:hypothetical protein